MNNHKNNGFTLIEIMVTVAIVGIFASIALPSFSRIIESNRISTASNELVSNLLLARSEALKRRNRVTVCSSSNQTSCNNTGDFSTGWIVFLDCDNDLNVGEAIVGCGPDDEETIIKVGNGFDSIYMNKNGADKKISYNFSGRLAIAASSVSIGKDVSNKKTQLVLSRVGKVKAKPHP